MHIPTGIIVIWSGSIANIPAGWVICDGNNGTPDLRDKFVIGAGGSLNPNDTGGSATHDHDFTGNGHTHTFPGGSGLSGGAVFSNTTAPTAVTGTTDSESNLPPFYALAFIMHI